jgi:hypothetical protein
MSDLMFTFIPSKIFGLLYSRVEARAASKFSPARSRLKMMRLRNTGTKSTNRVRFGQKMHYVRKVKKCQKNYILYGSGSSLCDESDESGSGSTYDYDQIISEGWK